MSLPSCESPLLSIILPVKGARPYFEKALASCGDHPAVEILVQDGDRDADAGQSDAINRGVQRAAGEWVTWLNADDLFLPGALERVLAFLRETPADWVAGNTMEIDAEDCVIRCLWDRGRRGTSCVSPVRVYGPSAFVRRRLWQELGGLDARLSVCMDTDFWCTLRAHGRWFRKLPDYVWGFRVHDGSRTRSATRSVEELVRQRAEVEAVMARHGVGDSFGRNLVVRLNRLFDGSYFKSARDTRRFRGRAVV